MRPPEIGTVLGKVQIELEDGSTAKADLVVKSWKENKDNWVVTFEIKFTGEK